MSRSTACNSGNLSWEQASVSWPHSASQVCQRRGLSGSHSYFGPGAPCRRRADPAHLWMCGQDGSQCSACEGSLWCSDGICDRVRERDCWLGLWGVWLDYSWSCRLAETEDLGPLVSCAVKPTSTYWPVGGHPTSTEPGGWLHCAAPRLSFWAFALVSFSFFFGVHVSSQCWNIWGERLSVTWNLVNLSSCSLPPLTPSLFFVYR